jgi:hypothetical protein
LSSGTSGAAGGLGDGNAGLSLSSGTSGQDGHIGYQFAGRQGLSLSSGTSGTSGLGGASGASVGNHTHPFSFNMSSGTIGPFAGEASGASHTHNSSSFTLLYINSIQGVGVVNNNNVDTGSGELD